MVPSIDSSLIVPAQKAQLLTTLRGLLRDVLRLRREGTAYAQLSAAQGYADGYMRALLDAGVCSHAELLGFVGEVRRGVDGPAVMALAVDSDAGLGAAA